MWGSRGSRGTYRYPRGSRVLFCTARPEVTDVRFSFKFCLWVLWEDMQICFFFFFLFLFFFLEKRFFEFYMIFFVFRYH